MVGQAKWTTTNHTKGQSSSKEGDVVYMVELEGSPLLWAPSGKPNRSFQQVPLPVRPTESSTLWKACRISQQKTHNIHQDNTRLHVSLMTREKLLQLGREVLIHSSYSPGIAPLCFHLLRSLQNSLNGKNFNSLEDCKWHLEQFFAQKDKKFWEDGIMKLPEKWQKVVEQNGEYVIQ